MPPRAFLSIASHEVAHKNDAEMLGCLSKEMPFSLEKTQTHAWEYQIKHLRDLAADFPAAHFYMEFLIPRMGRRVDLVVIHSGIVFVVEYKVGEKNFDRASKDQVYGYGLDLKNFHETSHCCPVVPILVATEAACGDDEQKPLRWDSDYLAHPLLTNSKNLAAAMKFAAASIFAGKFDAIDARVWESGRYRPTPTIIEAAQALYRQHSVAEISRCEAGARNLECTADYIADVIEASKREKRKVICFVTGVPGSGKTLAGMNLATARKRSHCDEWVHVRLLHFSC